MQDSPTHLHRTGPQEGSSFYCHHCHSRSLAVLKEEYDGFILKRKYLCCGFCGAELPVSGTAGSSAPEAGAVFPAEESPSSGNSAWDSLFGGDSSGSSGSHGPSLEDVFGGSSDAPASSSLEAVLPSPADSCGGEGGSQGEKIYHFCKNCRHHFENPFRIHCVLHDKDVEPLADCPDFAPFPNKPEF